MMGYGAGQGLGFGLGGWLMMLAVVAVAVALVLLVAWVVGRVGGASATRTFSGQSLTNPAATQAQPDPVELLRLRLARGEISVEEFAATKQALEGGR